MLSLRDQLFNSKSCQMILGAGAMRSAGLKNITAKHIGKAFLNHVLYKSIYVAVSWSCHCHDSTY